MDNYELIVFRDNAKNELLKIKSVEDGLKHLNKLQAIEVWVKAEKKDGELQNIVAEQKLRTQRILGVLLKEKELRPGGNTGKNQYGEFAIVPDENHATLEDIGLNKKQSSTFQQIASIPEKRFEEFIREKKANVDNAVSELTTAGALRLAKGAHVSNNSGENEWYTPECYIISARKVMGSIDLDPASNEYANKIIKAKKYFDSKTDGLKQKWFGNIWMNPPYAQPLINDFINRLETESYKQAIVLVNNATETSWGQKILELSNAVCFHSKRIRFINPENESNAPLQGQMIIYIGKNFKTFIDEFKQYGVCMKKGV